MSGFKGNNRNKRRGGRGGKGSRHAKKAEQSPDEKLSRKLSSLLRHRAHKNGLTDCLRTDGYVPLDRVLALPGFAQYNVDDIAAAVTSNDKQRFSMLEEEGEAGGDVTLYIRANQVR